jgi:enoyl-CoA hydratase/carnithine racemase
MTNSANNDAQTDAPLVLADDEAGVRTLTLNRPQALNAFNGAMFDALAQAFVAAGQDNAVKVVVVTGQGRAFSAGADLSSDGQNRNEATFGFPGMVDVIIDFPKPFIVAANGLGVGIGCTILGLADTAFMAESARMRCPFSALGLTAEACSTYTFPHLMGRQNASWFLLSAEWMSSTECVASGLAKEVLPDDGFLAAVIERAHTMARMPLSSLMQTKELIMAPHRDAMRTNAKAENDGLAKLRGGPANTEALAAFREKREPDFSTIR